MPLWTQLTSLCRTLTRGAHLDADLDAELRAHVELLTEEQIQAGPQPVGRTLP